jgi:hypothetical protein
MTVTFSITVKMPGPCVWCNDDDISFDPCCSFCHGTGIDPNADPVPCITLANSNARALIELSGLQSMAFDETLLYGEVSGEALQDITRRLIRLLNVDGLVDDSGLEPFTLEDAGALYIDCGRRPGYMREQLTRLLDLLIYASNNNLAVQWA